MCASMATRELEERDFDYVVVGTGLTESILAAALAHAGARVLHLDPNPFYGSTSATLRVDDFDDLFLENQSTEDSPPITSNDKLPENFKSRPVERLNFRDITFPNGVKRLVPADLRLIEPNVRRKIHLDLSTRTLMASGPTVDVMVRTKVGHYIDFRPIDATYVAFREDGLRKVPCSRSDVFQDRYITMLEKRLLMRFIKSSTASSSLSHASDNDEDIDDINDGDGDVEESSFEEHMRDAKLTDKLQTFLWHAVVLGSEKEAKNTSVPVAKKAIVRFQQSLMRFGTPTPFLYPNHGAAEIAQAFCRMCAVKGGTYVLRRGVAEIVTEKEKLVGVVTEAGEFLRCKALFTSETSRMGGNNSKTDESSVVWRAACVVDGSIVRGKGKRALIVVPKGVLGNNCASVRILQLDSAVAVCPDGKFVVHVQTVGGDGIESDVLQVLNHYTRSYEDDDNAEDSKADEEEKDDIDSDVNATTNGEKRREGPVRCETSQKPRLLWGVLYSRDMRRFPSVIESDFEGMHFLAEGGAEVDGEFCVETARLAFEEVMPQATFFSAEDEIEEKINEKQSVGNGVEQKAAEKSADDKKFDDTNGQVEAKSSTIDGPSVE